MLYLGSFGQNLKKAVAIFEIRTSNLLKDKVLSKEILKFGTKPVMLVFLDYNFESYFHISNQHSRIKEITKFYEKKSP